MDFFDQVYVLINNSDNRNSPLLLRNLTKLYKLQIKYHPISDQNLVSGMVRILVQSINSKYKNFLVFILDDQNELLFMQDFAKKLENWLKKQLAPKIRDNWNLLSLDGDFSKNTRAIAVHINIYHQYLQILQTPNLNYGHALEKLRQLCLTEYCLLADPKLVSPRNQTNEVMSKFIPKYTDLVLVSVIICAYNAEDTIMASVVSIQEQTYKFVEIVVVDDCSQDRTFEIVEQMSRIDPRIVLIKNNQNVGCYASRNRALKIAKGEFITFHDADDYSLDTRIEEQVISLLQHQVMFVSCLIIRSHIPNFDFLLKSRDNENLSNSLMSQVEQNRVHFKNDRNYQYCCKAILGMVTPLFRREIFEKIGLYWELRCIADAEYCERILYNYMKPAKLFQEGESVVTFLSQEDHIPGIYYKIKKVLYISREMNPENITNKYRDKRLLLDTYRQNWRQRLLGNFSYDYPKMDLA